MGIEISLKTDEMILIPKTWGSIIYHHQRGFHLIQFDHLGISEKQLPWHSANICQHHDTGAPVFTPKAKADALSQRFWTSQFKKLRPRHAPL
jgi:hypothetical protein